MQNELSFSVLISKSSQHPHRNQQEDDHARDRQEEVEAVMRRSCRKLSGSFVRWIGRWRRTAIVSADSVVGDERRGGGLRRRRDKRLEKRCEGSKERLAANSAYFCDSPRVMM